MNSGIDWAIGTFRILYGGFFVIVGLYGGYALLSGNGNPFDIPPGPGADFQLAMQATGFIVPLMQVAFVVGGAALMWKPTAPLGIVILAPIVVVIFFYHLLPGGNALWGMMWLAGLMLLAWIYRRAFIPLVTYTDRRA